LQSHEKLTQLIFPTNLVVLFICLSLFSFVDFLRMGEKLESEKEKKEKQKRDEEKGKGKGNEVGAERREYGWER
jgi:hypothetical protein